MKIEMLKTMQGSECGKFVKTYRNGEIYEVMDRLGNVFVNAKSAKEIIENVSTITAGEPISITKPVEKVIETKKEVVEEKMADAPLNKALNNSNYQNKSKRK